MKRADRSPPAVGSFAVMLTAKGYDVGFILKDGREVVPPKSYAMLHDPTGSDWGKNSILVAPFRRTDRELESPDAESYFGYVPRAGTVNLPPRAIGDWTPVGEVAEIDYWRPGEHRGSYWHPFKNGGWRFESKPRLYRLGGRYRLELGPGAKLNWRGFVWP